VEERHKKKKKDGGDRRSQGEKKRGSTLPIDQKPRNHEMRGTLREKGQLGEINGQEKEEQKPSREQTPGTKEWKKTACRLGATVETGRNEKKGGGAGEHDRKIRP